MKYDCIEFLIIAQSQPDGTLMLCRMYDINYY